MGIGYSVPGVWSKFPPAVPRVTGLAAFFFGVAVLFAALMPTLVLASLAMVLVGGFSFNFTSMANSVLQLTSAPQMRGRVMALWSIAFVGSTAVGGPLVGQISELTDPRWGLAVGGLAALAAAAWGFVTLRDVSTAAAVPERVTGAVETAAEPEVRAP